MPIKGQPSHMNMNKTSSENRGFSKMKRYEWFRAVSIAQMHRPWWPIGSLVGKGSERAHAGTSLVSRILSGAPVALRNLGFPKRKDSDQEAASSAHSLSWIQDSESQC